MLRAASEAGSNAEASKTAAAISALSATIQSELSRIKALEERLDSMRKSGNESEEIAELRMEVRSERSRIETMEASLNELAELATPVAGIATPVAEIATPSAVSAPSPHQAAAEPTLPTVTVGAGIRSSFQHTEPQAGSGLNEFQLGDARIYLSGDITKNVSAMFNTEYDSVTNKVGILDAVGEFHSSPKFNLWFGRFLPPSDRANLYGPFYAHDWAVYTDGIQDGYPFVFQGRDNGVAYWGDFKAGIAKIKVSVGSFDGRTATGNSDVLGAARVQIDFWDPEDGYYLNGTYYGDKNLLAIGGATQWQSGNTATTVDFLLERKLPNDKGVVSVEGEYSNYNRLGGYDPNYAKSQGEYGLVSYLIPKQIGIGRFEILGKFAKAEFTHGLGFSHANYRQNTAEVNLSYIIKQFDARVVSFYRDASYNNFIKDSWEAGVGLQVQLSKEIH